jgi:hypothetical protein
VPEQHLKVDLVVWVGAPVQQQTGAELSRHETILPLDSVDDRRWNMP